MKITDVKNIKASRKYSNALISTALENNNADKIYQDLVFITETIKTNAQLHDFLYNPVVTCSDKIDVIKKLFSVHIDKISLDFMLLLAENRRLNILEEVLNQYLESYNKHKNIVKPLIVSAVELDEERKKRIIQKLETKLSKTVLPEYKVSPDIIGGLIIEIDDKTIDCSIRAKFENLRQQLTKGNKYGNN